MEPDSTDEHGTTKPKPPGWVCRNPILSILLAVVLSAVLAVLFTKCDKSWSELVGIWPLWVLACLVLGMIVGLIVASTQIVSTSRQIFERLYSILTSQEGWFSHLSNRILLFLLAAILAGVLAALLPKGEKSRSETVATGLLWALACLASGAFAGFLFAIPRVHQEPPQKVDPKKGETPQAGETHREGVVSPIAYSGYSQEVNTNLETISDWLCKIIVGVGLIELRGIPTQIDYLAAALTRDLGNGFTHSYAGGLIVYFVILGFFGGYLVTRLILAGEFRRADKAALGEDEKKVVDELFKQVALNLDKQSDINAARAEKIIKQVGVDLVKQYDINSAIESGKIAQKFSGADDDFVDVSIKQLELARKQSPENRVAAIVLGTLYSKKREYREAIDVLRNALEAKSKKGTGEDVDAGDIYYNIACYYYRLFRDTSDQGMKDQYKVKMYEALREALRLNPSNASYAYTDADKEFELVWDEPEFISIVGPKPAAAVPPVTATPPVPDPPPSASGEVG